MKGSGCRFQPKAGQMKKCISLICILSLVCLSGCEQQSQINQPHRVSSASVQEEQLSEYVDVYLDTTPSMQGFLGLQVDEAQGIDRALVKRFRELVPETNFAAAVKETDYLIRDIWGEADIQYFRFDVGLVSFNKTETFINSFQSREFYQYSYYNALDAEGTYNQIIKDSHWFGSNEKNKYTYGEKYLSETISSIDTEHLSIIITDLYEYADQFREVRLALKGITKKQDITASLIGIQSQFAGVINDLSGDETKTSYGIDAFKAVQKMESIQYHPFYLLVIGEKYDVALFTDELTECMEERAGKERVNSMLFARKEPVRGFDDYSFKKAAELPEAAGIAVGPGFAKLDTEPEYLPLYELERDIYDESTELIHIFEVKDEDLLQLIRESNAEEFVQAIQVERLDEGEFISDSNIPKNLAVLAGISCENHQIEVRIRLQGVKKLYKNTYHINMKLCLPVHALEIESWIPEWISEWNYDDNELWEWMADQDNISYNGEQTSHLKDIAKVLLNITYPDYEENLIADLDYYIQVK